jgi:hypothetical protein
VKERHKYEDDLQHDHFGCRTNPLFQSISDSVGGTVSKYLFGCAQSQWEKTPQTKFTGYRIASMVQHMSFVLLILISNHLTYINSLHKLS